jgi:hypothetical protein
MRGEVNIVYTFRHPAWLLDPHDRDRDDRCDFEQKYQERDEKWVKLWGESVGGSHESSQSTDQTYTTTSPYASTSEEDGYDDDQPIGQSFSIIGDCAVQEDVQRIYRNLEPYLYPFIIEFCILSVGIYYMMWSNISKCPKRHFYKTRRENDGMAMTSFIENVRDSTTLRHETQYKSSFVVQADCHSASRGLFGEESFFRGWKLKNFENFE